MCKLQLKPGFSVGNTISFYISNESNDAVWFRYSCKLYDAQGHEYRFSVCDDSYKPNWRQKLEAKTSKQIKLDAEEGLRDGLLLECIINEEYDSIGIISKENVCRYKLSVKWVKE